jgi:hypothetical protein
MEERGERGWDFWREEEIMGWKQVFDCFETRMMDFSEKNTYLVCTTFGDVSNETNMVMLQENFGSCAMKRATARYDFKTTCLCADNRQISQRNAN